MITIIGWGLLIYLFISVALSLRKVRRPGRSPRALVVDLLATLALAVVIGVVAVPWNSAIPVWLWWLACALVGLLAGTIAYQLFQRRG
ncbi:MAG: hypothetical protein Q4G50_08435 [Corynebacterium sp.]|uniref:hypothetical protein n=1 Tax=Corynebacterium sp. TaxID=1720 RepID=UPI0026E0AC0B|nr:hypothetical protein [Corynebacterium sp.]MDO5670015.1 hypothetical protein [Corynebacterium sp.]